MGDGYAFTGVAHNSTSTRAATTVNLNAHVGLVSGNDTLSFRLVVQMPYDADATWPEATNNYLMDLCGASSAHEIAIGYNPATDKFRVYINGGWRLESGVQTFKAGDWIDISLTDDFAANIHNLYLNKELVDTDTTAMAAPTLTIWAVGCRSNYTEWWGGYAFAEYSAFDRVLTAIEVAQLYNLQRPLVDTGATDQPGIYILDGRFRMQSSQTGVRIEITADQVAGYDGEGTKQFSLEASTGKAFAGAGAVTLDEYGITFDGTDSMLWFTDDALNDFALGLIGADGFTISEYVGVNQKGLFRIHWNGGDVQLYLDYNDLADTVGIFSYAPLLISTPSDVDIAIIPGSDRLLLQTTYIELWELADAPAAPNADHAKLYVREAAPGKTELVIRFPTGAIQVIATEP